MTVVEDIFWKTCMKNGIDFAATLPCGKIKKLLSRFPADIPQSKLTREEDGVGICAGYWLAGGKPMMLIQSTGLGNSINALASLHLTYEIPLPIFASWRGTESEEIAAQKKLGETIRDIVEALGIEVVAIGSADEIGLVEYVIKKSYRCGVPVVGLIKPEFWGPQEPLEEAVPERSPNTIKQSSMAGKPELTRCEAIEAICARTKGEIRVCNIGVPSKELYEIDDSPLNFYMTGSLGLASSIGLGMALKTGLNVNVIDGDGALLYNPNALSSVARHAPENLTVYCLDNGVHGSTGGQATQSQGIDLELVAQAMGIRDTVKTFNVGDIQSINGLERPLFVHMLIRPGNSNAKNIDVANPDIAKRFRREVLKSL